MKGDAKARGHTPDSGKRMRIGVMSLAVSVSGACSCGEASSAIMYKLGRENIFSRAEEALIKLHNLLCYGVTQVVIT
jgi:hypothetical protein